MSVTIKDVANLAGVSPSTVSRTCNNHPSISKETKEKVRKAIIQLGYEPNVASHSYDTQKIKTIGIILPPSYKDTFENSFYLEAIRGISKFSNNHHYINAIITGENNTEILSTIQTMEKNDIISGFIVLYSKRDDEIINYLYNSGLLYVLIGKAYDNVNQTIYIDNDNILAGKDAADYLFNLGHKKIAYLGGDNKLLFSSDRKKGYLNSLANHKIDFKPEYCVELPSISSPLNSIYNLLSLKDRPTAIIVSDDIYGIALERICFEMGLKIPEDLSIISFNNSLFARLTSSQLTSVNINSVQLGIEAASQIINHIENPNLMATKIIVPHSIIKRKSCKKII